MHRELGRPSLVEAWLPGKLGQNRRLERIAELVDWARLEQLVAGIYAAPVGRPSYPPLLMVKVLLLQQWYNLSDPQLEEALGDRLSFRRFVGLGLQDDTPDHSTISRFRSALGEERSAQLFQELGQQLQARGMIVKQGTLLDATLVAAQVRRPSLAEGRGAKSPRDPDADWTYTRRGRQAHFGYKVHLGVDQRSGLVRQAVFTAAKVYESEVADRLVSGDEGAVYAVRAYESQQRRRWLQGRGIKDRIMHQRALPHWQQRRNALIDPVRKAVEKVFGTLKRSYGYRRVRYRGLARNAVEMWLKVMAYNLRRAERMAVSGG